MTDDCEKCKKPIGLNWTEIDKVEAVSVTSASLKKGLCKKCNEVLKW